MGILAKACCVYAVSGCAVVAKVCGVFMPVVVRFLFGCCMDSAFELREV